MAKITKEMLISEAIKQGDPEIIAGVLRDAGMHCLGCALAHGETVEEAAMVHGLDVDALIEKLNEAIEA